MVELLTFENIVALLTLTMLEIVLGIDNIVFLVILTGKLDPTKQVRARRIGLFAAIVITSYSIHYTKLYDLFKKKKWL